MTQKGKKQGKKPKIHDDLKGFDIQIDELGKVKLSMSQEKLNSFLNENVEDKKFSAKVRKQLKDLYVEGEEE